MSRVTFDPKELNVIEMYPPVISGGKVGNPPVWRLGEMPRFNRPIPPRENWNFMLRGTKPYWVPFAGLVLSDMRKFRPRLAPDAMANHQLFDGEPPYPFETEPNVRKGWFDVEWVYDYAARGATVRPGAPRVTDITCWEEQITMPDLDELDWESCEKNNVKYLEDDRLRELGIQCGFWERLMSLMDVENAAVAMIDEDEKEGVHRLFDKLADLYIDFIGRMKDRCDIDAVELHDDWGHQNGPFFSLDTVREMIVPYMRRVVDYCHSCGIWFELHSCGKNEMLVPAMIETGADLWCGQIDINDLDTIAHQYKDGTLAFGVAGPRVADDATEEEMRSAAKAWVEEFKDCRVAINAFFKPLPPVLKDALYEYSRKAWQNIDSE